LTTGLGSVNVANLVNQWSTVTFNPTTTNFVVQATTIPHGFPVPFTVSVTPNSGTGVPTGDISVVAYPLLGNPTSLGFWTLSGGSVTASTDAIPGGRYELTAYYSGDKTFAPSYSASGTYFTVTPEPSTTTETILAFDQNGNSIPLTNVPYGSLVYMRADVAGKSGFGIATGTVTFSDTFGPIPNGGTGSLNGEGNTSAQTYGFDAGQHSISASYAGDSSFDPSTTTQATGFTVAPGFFLVPWTPPVINIPSPGQSSWLNVTIYLSSGFTSPVAFTACSGLPAESTCTFGPSSEGADVEMITVSTTGPHQVPNLRAATNSSEIWLVGGLAVAGVFLLRRREARSRRFLLILALIALPACGGGGGDGGGGTHLDPGTPAGNYNITVTATGGSLTRTMTFLLVLK
jgi:Big-like domain-containing protein